MQIFGSSKLKYILGFSVWFSIGMTTLKWYVRHEDQSTAALDLSMAFTFFFWAFCGGLFGYILWRKKFGARTVD